MARRKVFVVRIEIDIHSVNCHEGRLGQSGNIAVRVNTLGSTAVTVPGHPIFPMHFHEKFDFEKVIDCVSTLTEVQDYLSKETLRMELLQWPRHYAGKPTLIAYFRTKLSSLLFPALHYKDISDETGIRLLMEPTEKFTGGSAPKVDVSTKTIVEETMNPRSFRTRASEEEGNCPEGDASGKDFECCWRSITVQGCGCCSRDHVKSKQRTRYRGEDPLCHWSPRQESGSCHDCCICNCYSVYFDSKPYNDNTSYSCPCLRARYIYDERLAPYRQLFYDNLDYFYTQLRDKKPNRNFL